MVHLKPTSSFLNIYFEHFPKSQICTQLWAHLKINDTSPTANQCATFHQKNPAPVQLSPKRPTRSKFEIHLQQESAVQRFRSLNWPTSSNHLKGTCESTSGSLRTTHLHAKNNFVTWRHDRRTGSHANVWKVTSKVVQSTIAQSKNATHKKPVVRGNVRSS